MAEPPELWLFAASNLLVLAIGGALTALSIAAVRRSPENAAFQFAVLGFGAVTLGSLVEAIYEFGIRGSYHLGGRELLAIHSVEGLLVAAGLAALFYSLQQY